MTKEITTEEVREAYQMTEDGLDFKKAFFRRGEEFDEWLAEVRRGAQWSMFDEIQDYGGELPDGLLAHLSQKYGV